MTCAKRTVRCTLIRTPKPKDEPNVPLTVVGINFCLNPQASCPRKPGDDYEKCTSICEQVGHAEHIAIKRAKNYDPYFRGSIALIEGHYYVCDSCRRELEEFGVAEIRLGEPNI